MRIEDVPVLDLQFLRGVSFSLGFRVVEKDEAGEVIGAFDLSDWTVEVTFTKVFGADLVVTSEESTDLDSAVTMDDPTTGQFDLTLTRQELSDPNTLDGDYRILLVNGPTAEPILRGHVQFVPFTTGGSA